MKNYNQQWWRACQEHTRSPTQAPRRALVIPYSSAMASCFWTWSEAWIQTFPPLVQTSILDNAESSQLHSPLPHVVLEGLCWSGGLRLGPQRDTLWRTQRRTALSGSAPVCPGTSPGVRNLGRSLSCPQVFLIPQHLASGADKRRPGWAVKSAHSCLPSTASVSW